MELVLVGTECRIETTKTHMLLDCGVVQKKTCAEVILWSLKSFKVMVLERYLEKMHRIS